jgi:hypothetical protein
MKKLFPFLLLIAACSTQNKESMRAEYDQLNKSLVAQEKMIDAYKSNKNYVNKAESKAYFQQMIDSLQADNATKQKRKDELAKDIFK